MKKPNMIFITFLSIVTIIAFAIAITYFIEKIYVTAVIATIAFIPLLVITIRLIREASVSWKEEDHPKKDDYGLTKLRRRD